VFQKHGIEHLKLEHLKPPIFHDDM